MGQRCVGACNACDSCQSHLTAFGDRRKTFTDPSPSLAPRLGAILSAQVLSGTSNNFLIPFTAPDATTVFAKNVSALEAAPGPGGVIMWVARLPDSETPLPALDVDGGETGHGDVVGSVQLAFHMAPNGQFRSEVRKLLVDERYQRRGIARRLMGVLEDAAREHGSTLCVSARHATAQCSTMSLSRLGTLTVAAGHGAGRPGTQAVRVDGVADGGHRAQLRARA